MSNSERQEPVILNSDNLTRYHEDARDYCVRELNQEHPDYQAAQVYAILSVEEALRDLAAAVSRAAGRLV